MPIGPRSRLRAGLLAVAGLTLTAVSGSADSAELPVAVYVEDAPAAAELLLRAEEAAVRGRLADAAALLDRVIEEHGSGLVPVDAGGADPAGGVAAGRRYVEARARAEERLAEDPALLAAYRARFAAEAARQRAAVSAVAAPAERARGLAEVARRFGATETGRVATLDAAALALESGDSAAARRWLRAAGSAYDGRAETLLAAADRLEEARRGASGSGAAASPVPAADAGTAEVLAEATWTHWFGGAGPGAESASGGWAATPAPVPAVRGADVYVNTGETLIRLDRDAGRRVWETAAPGAEAAASAGGFGSNQPPPGGRGVLVRGPRLFGVLGREAAGPGSRRFRFGAPEEDPAGTRLVCVEASDGEAVWSVEPAGLDPALERASFVGTPLGAAGDAGDAPVVALLRRTGRAGFTDFQAVGLDPATGALRWLRPISSVSTPRRFGDPGPLRDAATAAGGRVFLGETLGVVAALDAASGAIAWLRVPSAGEIEAAGGGFADPRLPRVSQALPSVGGPLLTGAGLLLPAGGSGGGPLLLNPADGRALPLPGPLGQPAAGPLRAVQPLDAGPDRAGLLAVRGSDALGLDAETLDLRWSMPLRGRTAAPAESGAATGVVVVVGNEALRLRGSDGAILERRAWPSGGTFVPAGAGAGGFLAGQGGSVSLFDRSGAALARLAARVRAAPGDPLPALALAFRGVDAAEPAALIAGADAALRAAEGNPTDASGVGDELLELVAAATDLPAGSRRAVLDRLLAAGGADPVALALVSAEVSAEEGDPAAVVAGLQAVIDEPSLADRFFTLGGVTRRAGLEARERLAAALAAGRSRGLDLYAPQRERARAALAAAVAAADPEALIEVARRFPFAAAAADALGAAATLREDPTGPAGGRQEARSLRRWAYRAALGAAASGGDPAAPAAVAAAAAGLVAAEVDAGRVAAARGWADRFAREMPGLSLPLPGGPVDPAEAGAWIDRVASAASATSAAPAAPAAGGLPRLPEPRLAGPRRPGRPVPAVPALADPLDGGPVRLGGSLDNPFSLAEPPGAAGRARVVIAGARADAWEVLAAEASPWPGFRFPAPPDDAVVLLDDGSLLVLFSPSAGRLYRVRPPAPSADAGTLEPWDLAPLLAAVPDAAAGSEVGASRAGVVGGVARRLAEEQARDAARRAFLERMRQNRARQRAGGGPAAEPDAVDTLFAAATPTSVVVADTLGRVVATDPGTGRVQWARRAPVELLTGLALGAEHLLVRGVEAPGTEAAVFRLARMDPLTGGVLAPEITEAAQEPRGVALGEGSLLVAFDRFVAAYGLPEGGLLWRAPLPADEAGGFTGDLLAGAGVVAAAPASAPGAGRAAVGGTLPVYDAATGELAARPLLNAAPADGVVLAEGLLHTADGAAFDLDGTPHWSPAGRNVASPRLLALTGAAVTAGEVLRVEPDDAGTGGLVLARFDRATGRRTGSLSLPAVPDRVAPGRLELRVVDGLGVVSDDGGLLLIVSAEGNRAAEPPA